MTAPMSDSEGRSSASRESARSLSVLRSVGTDGSGNQSGDEQLRFEATRQDVFLSYCHADQSAAMRFVEVLEGFGFSVWWDHALLAGDDYRTRIAEKIRDARVVVVLLSTHSVRSGWVLDEAGRASEAGKLVPIRIDEVEMPMGFGGLQHVDLLGGLSDCPMPAIEPVLQAVERFSGHPRTSFVPRGVSEVEPAAGQVQSVILPDRFHVGWLPNVRVRRVMGAVWPVYILALLLMIVASMHDSAVELRLIFAEWLKLVHIYSGMIVFGGGIFLLLVFRLADRQPTPSDRASIADVARPLFGGWRLAAVLQLVTGIALVLVGGHLFATGWVIQSFILYLAALRFWWTGFGFALGAAERDALYRGAELVGEYRRVRDRNLSLAVILTAWVLITMIYKDRADVGTILDALTGHFVGLFS